jgi:murein L,D-transpeptidase YcbB/YkuD
VGKPEDDDWLAEADTSPDLLGGRSAAPRQAAHTTHASDGNSPVVPRQLSSVAKLGGIVFGSIVLVVGVVTIFEGTDRGSVDRSYFHALLLPTETSSAVGSNFERYLLRNGVTRNSLRVEVEGLLRQQQTAYTELESVSPPPRLRIEQEQALTAFRMRSNGLLGLIAALHGAKASVAAVSTQAERFIASDVLWQTFFVEPAAAELAREGVKNLAPPPSTFLSSPDSVSPAALAADFARGAPSATGSGPSVLRRGSAGDAVLVWQRQLEQWLKQTSQARSVRGTASFDQATEAATLAFQQAAGLTADGVVGPATRAAMTHALAGG